MRPLLDWLTPRRLWTAAAVGGLIVIGVVSSGRAPDEPQWVRIPDLGFLFVVVLLLASLAGLALLVFSKPVQRHQKPGEERSLKAVLVLIAVVGAAAFLLGPDDGASSPDEEPETATAETVEEEAPADGPLGEIDPDLIALTLLAMIVAAAVVRGLRWARREEIPTSVAPVDLQSQLEPVVERAQFHLAEEADPRLGVIQAYAVLEHSLADLGLPRHHAETPSEHMSRALADLPDIEAPAVQLSRLFELARFSHTEITEAQRRDALVALESARADLGVGAG